MAPIQSVTASLQVARGEVQCWCVGLDVPSDWAAGLRASLAPDERERAARYRLDDDRRRYVVARAVLRELLGRYLGADAGEVRFAYNAFGKPALAPELGSGLKFNLTHSADLALIAVSAEADVGVDVEYLRPRPDYEAVARHFFTAREVHGLSALPRHLRTQAFLGCWTKKEACVKACGAGLAMELTEFTVPVAFVPSCTTVDLSCVSGKAGPAESWSLYALQPAPGYIGALAIRGGGWRLTRRRWQM